MKRITLACKDPGKWFHDCKDCEHYEKCDYFQKVKQNPSSNDGLGKTSLDSDKLIDVAKIIMGNTPDPIKLITAQIQYCRLVEKMSRQNASVK